MTITGSSANLAAVCSLSLRERYSNYLRLLATQYTTNSEITSRLLKLTQAERCARNKLLFGYR